MARLIIHRGMDKRAAAEDGPSFEQQFGILTNALIADKYPKMDRMKLAFQLIDKTDDNASAVGAGVYLVGGSVIFVPAFYKNGKIRTGDMMFLAQTQQFLPLSDPWLAWVQQRELTSSGDLIDSRLEKTPDDNASISITEMSDPIVKTASIYLKGLLRTDPDLTRNGCDASVLDTVLAMGKTASAGMLDNLTGDRDFLNAALRFYSGDELDAFAKEAAELNADRGDGVEVVLPYTKEAAALSESDREALDRDGFLIVKQAADRPGRTVVRDTDLRKHLMGVSRAGIAELLRMNGSVERMAVLPAVNTLDSGDPDNDVFKTHSYADTCKAYDLIKSRYLAIPVSKSEVEVRDLLPGTMCLSKTFEELTAETLKHIGTSVLTNPRKELSFRDYIVCPDGVAYRVESGYAPMTDGWTPKYGDNGLPSYKIGGSENQASPIVRTGMVIWPRGSRVVKVSDSVSPDYVTADTLDSLMTGYLNRNYDRVKITPRGNDVTVDRSGAGSSTVSVKEASLDLVRSCDVSPEDARTMLHEALDSGSTQSYLISKEAADEGWMNASMPVNRFENRPEKTDLVEMPTVLESPEQLQKAVTQAAESGIKEVFDVTAFKLLVRQNRFMEEVHEDIPLFMRVLDSLCRKLFLLYWHVDDFEDAYGMVKLKSLEESLKTTIDSLSDLTVFFKVRGRDQDGSLSGSDGDLMEGHGL